MEELIAKRYVDALTSVVTDKEGALSLLSVLAESLEAPSVKSLLEAPIVPADKKTELILSAVEGADATFVNFIRLLGEHKRLSLIPVIAKVLSKEIRKEKGLYEGTIESDKPLQEDEIKKLEASLKRYTGSDVTLKQVSADADGLHVKVEDLGIEVHFSKEKVKNALIDFIERSI